MTSAADSARGADGPRIVVTVGTDHHQFDRLIGWINDWLRQHPEFVPLVFVQSGAASVVPDCPGSRFLEVEELSARLDSADVIVCHGGPGSIAEAWTVGKLPIVVARLPGLGEIVDGHQVDFCRRVAELGRIRLAQTASEFAGLLDEAARDHTAFRISLRQADVDAAVARFSELVDAMASQPRRRRPLILGGRRIRRRPVNWRRPSLRSRSHSAETHPGNLSGHIPATTGSWHAHAESTRTEVAEKAHAEKAQGAGMKLRPLLGATAMVLVASGGAALPAVHASAATTSPAVRSAAAGRIALPAGAADGNVSSTALSSWETDGTVWALAYANGVVYVGGQFNNALPPGTPAGGTTGEVGRTYLAAFNSTTGALITSFNPVITGSSGSGVWALSVSPNGQTLYVGGLFNHINGSYRDNLAAFNISGGTPTLTSWTPSAFGKVTTIAPSPSGSAIYIGGAFNQLGTSPNIPSRLYAGAVDASGNILPWAPVLNNTLTSIAVAPDNSQVLVGGYFGTINGVAEAGGGAVDPTAGTTTEPWGANIVPNSGSCSPPAIKDIIVSGSTAYLASEGTGGGCFDGDYAVTLNLSQGDPLLWQNDCLGATQSMVIINGYLFKGSHAHDCAYAPGGFPQVNSGSGWVTYHLLDQSLTDGSLGHWTPNTSSPAGGLGPRVMATDGNQMFLGGDFATVNGAAQEGFAIFPAAPDSKYPTNPSTAPTATSSLTGVDSVSFPAVSSRDVGTLSYQIFRDGGKTPIATLTATSWPWALPVLQYQDTGLTPGSTHTYTYLATDGTHNSARSPASAAVTVASTSPSLSYQQTALNDHPSFFWPLNDSGSTAADATGNGSTGTYESGTTQGAAAPFTGQTGTAFDGNSGLVTANQQVTGPQTFSIEGWFKTTTITGGKLIGFGGNQTGASGSYDRHIYMMNDGQLVYGIWNGQTETVETPNVYNDGQWHYVVATYDANVTSGPNMALYIDGQSIGTATSSSAQGYSGYWRVGGDNLNGWNLDPWGSNSQGTTQPASYYFNGTMADVAVYPTALSSARIGAHFAAGLNQGG